MTLTFLRTATPEAVKVTLLKCRSFMNQVGAWMVSLTVIWTSPRGIVASCVWVAIVTVGSGTLETDIQPVGKLACITLVANVVVGPFCWVTLWLRLRLRAAANDAPSTAAWSFPLIV